MKMGQRTAPLPRLRRCHVVKGKRPRAARCYDYLPLIFTPCPGWLPALIASCVPTALPPNGDLRIGVGDGTVVFFDGLFADITFSPWCVLRFVKQRVRRLAIRK